ncbi:MAG TPA: hypothetical protein VFM59_02135 [Salinimicrobium sp.]|nr:hypothetical protein [Salinimicrobium sp.]
MVLKSIEKELETAVNPVGKLLHQGNNYRVMALGFKENMVLKEHKSDVPTKLLVIKGEVVYNNATSATTLGLYDEFEIPVEEYHWVEAKKDSLFLLFKG